MPAGCRAGGRREISGDGATARPDDHKPVSFGMYSANVREFERLTANQRAGTGRLAGPGNLLNGRRAGQASSGSWAAWNLLLPF